MQMQHGMRESMHAPFRGWGKVHISEVRTGRLEWPEMMLDREEARARSQRS